MMGVYFSDFVDINPRVNLEKGKEYPFVEMGEVDPVRRYVNGLQKRLFQGGGTRFRAGDTLFARITPCLENGKIAQFISSEQVGFGSTEFFVFRAVPNISDPGFVYYLSKSDLIRQPAEKSMTGASGRQRADLNSIVNVEVPVVSLAAQRKITAILSAYDDLIENNLRRIKILEEMAQNLYREWFVNFRFPDHEQTRFVDSPLGRIPEGWDVKKLGELLSGHIGGGWGKEEQDDDYSEPAWVIRGTDIPSAKKCDASKVPFRYHPASNLKTRKLIPGDIIFEVSGGSKGQPLGRTLLITSELMRLFKGYPVICASFCKRVQPNPERYAPELLYMSYIEGYASGEIEQYQVQSTGISNFKWSDYIEKVFRSVPPRLIQDGFIEIISPMLSQIAILGLKNHSLRQTRDLLLPKLISGEVDVSELDIKVPEEVAI